MYIFAVVASSVDKLAAANSMGAFCVPGSFLILLTGEENHIRHTAYIWDGGEFVKEWRMRLEKEGDAESRLSLVYFCSGGQFR